MNDSLSTPQPDSLAAQFMQQLQGQPLDNIASELGVGTDQAHSAVAMAVPLLLGAMGRNAQDAQGAQSLLGALQRDHMPASLGAGLDLGGLLGAVLGGMGAGQGPAGPAAQGPAILGHILGHRREQAETQLGQASGLGSHAGKLLSLLAPIVMAFVAQRVRAGNVGASDLGQVLGRGQPSGSSGAGGLLAQVLDQDGNGRLDMGDLMRIGGNLLGGRR